MQIKSQWAINIDLREWLQWKSVTPPKAGKVVEKVGQWWHAGIINLLEKQFAHFLESKHAWPVSWPQRWRHLLPSLPSQGWSLEPGRWKERPASRRVVLWPSHACRSTSHFDYLLSFFSVSVCVAFPFEITGGLFFSHASVLETIIVPGLNSVRDLWRNCLGHGGEGMKGERTSVNQGVVEIFMSCSMYLNIPLTTGALDSFSEI